MKSGLLCTIFAVAFLAGCKDESSSGTPAPTPGRPLDVAGNEARTEDEGTRGRIEEIRKETKGTQEYAAFLEEVRDHQLEKLAVLESKKAKIEEESAALGQRLTALEKIWNLGGACTGTRPP